MNPCAVLLESIVIEVPKPTMAELLLSLAESVLFPRDQLIVMPSDSGHDSYKMQRVNLAIAFYKREPNLHFQAIVENWDLNRIIREVY